MPIVSTVTAIQISVIMKEACALGESTSTIMCLITSVCHPFFFFLGIVLVIAVLRSTRKRGPRKKGGKLKKKELCIEICIEYAIYAHMQVQNEADQSKISGS